MSCSPFHVQCYLYGIIDQVALDAAGVITLLDCGIVSMKVSKAKWPAIYMFHDSAVQGGI